MHPTTPPQRSKKTLITRYHQYKEIIVCKIIYFKLIYSQQNSPWPAKTWYPVPPNQPAQSVPALTRCNNCLRAWRSGSSMTSIAHSSRRPCNAAQPRTWPTSRIRRSGWRDPTRNSMFPRRQANSRMFPANWPCKRWTDCSGSIRSPIWAYRRTMWWSGCPINPMRTILIIRRNGRAESIREDTILCRFLE